MDFTSLAVGLVIGLVVAAAIFFILKTKSGSAESARVELQKSLEEAKRREEETAKASQLLSVELAKAQTEAKRTAELLDEIAVIKAELRDREGQVADFKAERAKFETTMAERHEAIQRERAMLAEAEKKLTDTFRALSADALKATNEEFIKTAQEVLKQHTTENKGDLEKRQQAIEALVKPLQENLAKQEQQLNEIEKSAAHRTSQQSELMRNLQDELEKQRMSAMDLKAILKGPTQRGRMGELQFEVVLQRAGLVRGQHYDLQVQTESGKRPDCVIRLPDEGRIVVDIKTPLNSYQDAMEIEDEAARTLKLDEHARLLRQTIDKLAGKEYEGREEAIVVMYLPIEASLSAALLRDPEITAYGWEKGVVVASPTLFFAFLRSIALAWRQHQLNQNYREIVEVGKQMLTRLRVVTDHFVSLGDHLNKTVDAYEKTASSIDRNLYTSARRFQSLGVPIDKPLKELPPVKEADAEMKQDLKKPLDANEQTSLLEWDTALLAAGAEASDSEPDASA